MGVTAPFNPSTDFTAMLEGEGELLVDEVVHKVGGVGVEGVGGEVVHRRGGREG
jgi:hypothetical protein